MTTYTEQPDTNRPEDAVIEAALLPHIRQRLDELAAGLAGSHSPITADGRFNLEAGTALAHRALTIALIEWLAADCPDLDVQIILYQDGGR